MRVRIDLGYDGGGFHGWARQPGLRTVQGELEQALDTVLRVEGCSLTVAGRTDTGVHARGQVAHLDLEQGGPRRPGPQRGHAGARCFGGATGCSTPTSGCTGSARPRPASTPASRPYGGATPTGSPTGPTPSTRCVGPRALRPRPLDDGAMSRAAKHLLGEHDFAAFCKKRPGPPRSAR